MSRAFPNLVTRIEENLKKNRRNVDLTKYPGNTTTWCIFARDCMWASFQMRRSVVPCIRGCQYGSFSNTQDIVNILTGSILENEQDGEPVIVRDTEPFSDEGLTDGEWKHLLLEESITAQVNVFSDSVFCTGPGALDPISASKLREKKAEAVMKSDNCKKQKRHCKPADLHSMSRVTW